MVWVNVAHTKPLLTAMIIGLVAVLVQSQRDNDHERSSCRCRSRCRWGEYSVGRCQGPWLMTLRLERCYKMDCDDCRCSRRGGCRRSERFVGFCRSNRNSIMGLGLSSKCCQCEREEREKEENGHTRHGERYTGTGTRHNAGSYYGNERRDIGTGTQRHFGGGRHNEYQHVNNGYTMGHRNGVKWNQYQRSPNMMF